MTELNTKRREVRNDTNLSDADKKTKTKTINEEINGKIKALMTAEQFAKWEKLQAARRAARAASGEARKTTESQK